MEEVSYQTARRMVKEAVESDRIFIDTLTRKLAIAREALGRIANEEWAYSANIIPRHHMAREHAHQALAQIDGED